MNIATRTIEYDDGETVFEAYQAWDDSHQAPRPGILVSHTIRGRTDFEESKARELARQGYVGFALDVYGKSNIGADDATARSCMDALKADRALLHRRLARSLATMRAQDEVDANRLAAIGYCFGGLCVLDLARLGEPLAGVVSFHGLLSAPQDLQATKVTASVLALHGWDDPMATPDDVVKFTKEMSELGADWQVHAYGNTVHSFTNPAANDTGRGTVYHASADRRSWTAMENFLKESFAR